MAHSSDLPAWPSVTFTELPPEVEVSSRLLDLHSFINLINVISSVASLAGGRHPPPVLQALIVDADTAINTFVQSGGASVEALLMRPDFRNSVAALTHAWAEGSERERHWSQVLNEVLLILDRRLHEYRELREQPSLLKHFSPQEIRQQLIQFFRAMSVFGGSELVVADETDERPERAHCLVLEFDPGAEAVFALPQLALDTLHDLAANARKYSPLGGEITVRCRRVPEGIFLSVHDEGVGIPEEELPNVIGFGYRARNAWAITTMGAGFGLTKALSVASRFGGRLTIASSLGQGTWVEVFLPDARSTV